MNQIVGAGMLYVAKIGFHKYKLEQSLHSLLESGQFNQKLLVFSDLDLTTAEWEHAKEFEMNGHKYDVVFCHEQNGIRFYHCIDDTIEQALFNQLNQKQNQEKDLKFHVKQIVLHFEAFRGFDLYQGFATIEHSIEWQNQYAFMHSHDWLKPPTV